MKRLFVWLASVSICAAQAVSIGPFATEDWVDERIKESESITNGLASASYVDDVADEIRADFPDVSGLATKEYVDAVSNAIPDTSMFATVEYVNTTSNNLALLMDDLVSEEELRSSVSNIVPAWALVPVPPVTAEVDPIFTAWEGSNLYVRTTHSGPVVLQNTLVVGTASVDQNVTTAVAEGTSKAYANNSHAEGRETRTASNATFSHVEGQGSKTGGQYSHAAGYRALTAEGGGSGGAVVVNPHDYAWAWNGDYTIGDQAWYASHGPGTFNVNPKGGLDGFYIGTNKLSDLLSGGGISSEHDPIFKSWADDNTNSLLKTEVDPAFTNWLATTNVVQYSSVTGIVEDIIDYVAEDNFVTGVKAAEDEHYIYVWGDEFRVEDFTTVVTNATAGNIAAIDTNGNLIDSGVSTNLYLRRKGGTMAGILDMANYSIHQVSPFGKEFWICPGMLYATGGHQLEFTTNGVLKAGTVATVEDLANITETDPVFNEWTNNAVIVAGKGAMSVNGSSSTALGHNAKTYSYCTLAVGNDIIASNQFAVAVGVYDTKAIAPYATAVGPYNTASGESSTAVGMWTTAADAYSTSVGYRVTSHGPGTFNINPTGGLSGFWIGNKNLKTYLETMDNVLYKSTTLEGSESEFQSLKYYDLLDTFVGSRRANRYVSLYGALYVGEKADLVSTAFDPNPGGFTLSVGRGNTEAKGRSSVALGNNVTTADDDSFVTGYGGKVTGKIGFASGKNTRAKGNVSTATGEGTTAAGYASSSSGWYTLASAGTSQAHGKYAYAKDSDSWTWSAGFDATNAPRASLWTAQHADNIQSLTNGFYESHGSGTFNIDPIGGTAGFWIGETNLATHLDNSSKIALDAIAPAFRASNVYTNGDCVIYAQHLYECTNYTGTAGWRAGDWQQTTVTGILGNLRRILDAINGEAL